jgi:hypothetical protein
MKIMPQSEITEFLNSINLKTKKPFVGVFHTKKVDKLNKKSQISI